MVIISNQMGVGTGKVDKQMVRCASRVAGFFLWSWSPLLTLVSGFQQQNKVAIAVLEAHTRIPLLERYVMRTSDQSSNVLD